MDRPSLTRRDQYRLPGVLALGKARAAVNEEPTTTPEDTLRAAGIARRQTRYQRRLSALLAGRAEEGA